MVVAHDAGLLALSAALAAYGAHPKRCRSALSEAVKRLERPHANNRKSVEAAQCIRTTCFACARCPGV